MGDSDDLVLEANPVLAFLLGLVVGAQGQVFRATCAVAHGLGVVQPSIAARHQGISVVIVGIR